MPRKTFALLLTALACAVAAPAASAAGPADQQQPTADTSVTMPPGIAQTFTVGAGGMLDGLTLTSTSGGRVAFQIYDVKADGTPDVARPRLPQNGSAALLAGVPATIPVTAFAVAPGDRLAIALGTIRSYDSVSLAAGSGDPYPAGTLFSVSGYWTFTPVTGVDLAFATHVTAPAPTDLALRTLKSSGGRPTATLTSGGLAVGGRSVTFRLLRSSGEAKATCSAITGADGVASCASVKWSLPAGGSLTAAFAGDARYAPSTSTIR